MAMMMMMRLVPLFPVSVCCNVNDDDDWTATDPCVIDTRRAISLLVSQATTETHTLLAAATTTTHQKGHDNGEWRTDGWMDAGGGGCCCWRQRQDDNVVVVVPYHTQTACDIIHTQRRDRKSVCACVRVMIAVRDRLTYSDTRVKGSAVLLAMQATTTTKAAAVVRKHKSLCISLFRDLLSCDTHTRTRE